MYKLKSIVRRSTSLIAAFALMAAALLPASSVFADALNPLTDRSLTLSSSAPGWDYTDGSGNSTYAMPNSGANGQKTGNTFSFKVSSNSTTTAVTGFTFQYCTGPAGNCTSPGNNPTTGTAPNMTRGTDSVANQTSDLNVAMGTSATAPSEISSTTFASLFANAATGGADAANITPTLANNNGVPSADSSQGTFVVMSQDAGASTWSYSPGWVMTATNKEDGTLGAGTATGANNYIELTDTGTGGTGLKLQPGTPVKVIFFGTNDNYITNPGEGAFFVKINDYVNVTSTADLTDANVLDGGVTVANVMNQSISIQTRVLETMDFSVGTVDPDTLSSANGTPAGEGGTPPAVPSQLTAASGLATHGACDPILMSMTPQTIPADPLNPANTLILGNSDLQNSLSTKNTYSTHSYWRLSSNSSAGATVYYSGVTLSNTEGDQIPAIGADTAKAPHPGTAQFGLALDNGTTAPYNVNYAEERGGSPDLGDFENGADNAATGLLALQAGTVGATGIDPSFTTDNTGGTSKAPELQVNSAGDSLAPVALYENGTGTVNKEYTAGGNQTPSTSFAFDPNSNLVPAPLATESDAVVDCATGKVRYIADISATTPAGIYTTKINYIAAPQY